MTLVQGYIRLPSEKHSGWHADIEIPEDGTLDAMNAKYLAEAPTGTKVLHVNFSTADVAFLLSQSSLEPGATIDEIINDLGLSSAWLGTTREGVLVAVPSLNGNDTIEYTDPETGQLATYETPKLPLHYWL